MENAATALSEADGAFLLALARRAISEHLVSATFPQVDASSLVPGLRAPLACFVTLTKTGELRGCVGNLQPREPLYRAVMSNACGAAFRDMRFSAVRSDELSELDIEISVLNEPVPLAFDSPEELLQKLRPNVDGVVLKTEGRIATFLPKVWEKLPDRGRFMDAIAEKARLPIHAWRDPNAEVLTYQVESFAERAKG